MQNFLELLSGICCFHVWDSIRHQTYSMGSYSGGLGVEMGWTDRIRFCCSAWSAFFWWSNVRTGSAKSSYKSSRTSEPLVQLIKLKIRLNFRAFSKNIPQHSSFIVNHAQCLRFASCSAESMWETESFSKRIIYF